jgi:AcrR family transcriptional regulator
VAPSVKSRSYRSPARAAAAQQTRRRILDAARTELLRTGYAGATVSRIAATAGVAVDTVYVSVGRKPELFRLLLETAISGTDEAVPADRRTYVQEIRALPCAEDRLRRYARAVREIGERLWPLQRVLVDAAAHDPALKALRDEISARRARNMRAFAADVLDAEGAGPVSADYLADVVWATAAPETAALLVGERGWPPERYEQWLVETWTALVVAR